MKKLLFLIVQLWIYGVQGGEMANDHFLDLRGKKAIVAIIADNQGTEITDFVIPFGILKQSGAFEVKTVSTHSGVVNLMPSAVQIEADLNLKEFDNQFPQGADIVIVPAMHDSRNEELIQWIRKQHELKAKIVSICEGARLVAGSGVLNGFKATTHWYALGQLEFYFPQVRWQRNTKYVFDGPTMTTAGVSASIPATFALLESVAGTEIARKTAAEFGVSEWNSSHNSEKFKLTAQSVWTLIKNTLAFWKQEDIQISVRSGFDEIELALVADIWSRTYRSTAYGWNSNVEVVSKRGMKFVMKSEKSSDAHEIGIKSQSSLWDLLDLSLRDVSTRYGTPTKDWVALQLEYESR